MGYHRKKPALFLCKSIVISIQWFQIPHIITFSTIHNLAVLFSGARVSQNLSLVPQLQGVPIKHNRYLTTHNYFFHNIDISKIFNTIVLLLYLIFNLTARGFFYRK